MVFTVLFYIFVAVTVIQIIYHLFFAVFSFSKEKTKKLVNIPISVIICIKNKADELENYIQKLQQQEYQNFEIVLINNASSDTTLEVMEKLQQQFTNIKIVNVRNTEAFWANEKYALTLGIKAANNEHLLFTKIDSEPTSKQWIGEMATHFSQKNSIVIGYQKLKSKKLSFGNLLIRFEHLSSTIKAFTFTKLKSPFAANSSNLAYTKSEFFKTNGFINHINFQLGQGDLFIKDAATNTNTTCAVNKNSFVRTSKILSFKNWIAQKRKQTIVFSHYKFKHRFFLTLFKLSKLIFYPLAIYLAILNWKVITPFILLYYTTLYIIFGKAASKFQEKQVLYFLPFLELSLISLQIVIFISNTISKPKPWK
ncbi:MAG: glycosyltransferase [Tenacibaculum sp.]